MTAVGVVGLLIGLSRLIGSWLHAVESSQGGWGVVNWPDTPHWLLAIGSMLLSRHKIPVVVIDSFTYIVCRRSV